MGLDIHSAQFLWNQKKRGVTFGRMLTLGHQSVYMRDTLYQAHLDALSAGPRRSEYADDFFRGLGATTLDFMDASTYEGATVIHDLNQPLPKQLAESYDIVFDGGSLEHVFNFPVALKSCMEMVRPGGHLVIITTWNNYAGHGFYQFSPELFYSSLAEENGYTVEQMLIVQKDCWYSVAKPSAVGDRVELMNNDPTMLFLTAKRLASKPIFAVWPQQSDYSARWAPARATDAAVATTGLKEKFVAKSRMLQSWQQRWRLRKYRRLFSVSNRKSFQPLDAESFPPLVR